MKRCLTVKTANICSWITVKILPRGYIHLSMYFFPPMTDTGRFTNSKFVKTTETLFFKVTPSIYLAPLGGGVWRWNTVNHRTFNNYGYE